MPRLRFKLAALIAALSAALVANPVHADDAFTDKRAGQRLLEQMDKEVQAGGAPIKSMAEFEARRHDGSKGMSAFDKLPEAVRREFLGGLNFRDGELIGLSFASLKGRLGPQDGYRLLGMFGTPRSVAVFVDDLPDTTAEDALLRQALLASLPPREPVRFASAASASTPLMRMDPQDGAFHVADVQTQSGLTLAVYFAPTCGPCIRAAKDFEQSQALKRVMVSCGRWTAQLDAGTNAIALRDWSAKYDNASIWAIGDWARYGTTAPQGTPTFLLIRDGKVVDQLIGWPYEGQEAVLLKLVRRWDKERRCV